MNPPIITCSRISVNGIFRDVSLIVRPGEKVVLFGPSGGGKSSILKALTGLLPLDSGQVTINGIELSPSNVIALRRSMAYIDQEPVMGEKMVRDAILLPFSFKGMKNALPADDRILSLCKRVKFSHDILDRNCQDLSGGEKQRIAVVRSILMGKHLFFLDEITSALDQVAKKAVISLFRKKTYTILSVSHDEHWQQLCQRSYRVSRGRIHSIGSIS